MNKFAASTWTDANDLSVASVTPPSSCPQAWDERCRVRVNRAQFPGVEYAGLLEAFNMLGRGEIGEVGAKQKMRHRHDVLQRQQRRPDRNLRDIIIEAPR